MAKQPKKFFANNVPSCEVNENNFVYSQYFSFSYFCGFDNINIMQENCSLWKMAGL